LTNKQRVSSAFSGGVDSSVAASPTPRSKAMKSSGCLLKNCAWLKSVTIQWLALDAKIPPMHARRGEIRESLSKRLTSSVEYKESYRRLHVCAWVQSRGRNSQFREHPVATENQIRYFLKAVRKASKLICGYRSLLPKGEVEVPMVNPFTNCLLGADPNKDSELFPLPTMKQSQLRKVALPNCSLQKPEVREIAKKLDLDYSR